MKNQEKPYTFDRVVRIVIALLIITGLGLLINRLSAVILPFLIAWFLAYFIHPIVLFFQHKLRLKNRVLSIVVTLLLIFGLLGLVIYFLQAPVINEIQRLMVLINDFVNQPINIDFIPEAWIEFLKEYLKTIDIKGYLTEENIEKIITKLLPGAWTIISSSLAFVLNLVILIFILLYVIFISKDYEILSEGWINLVPKNYRHFALGMAEDVEKGMNSYFRGQSLIAMIVGILFAIGFKIINLPMGITFGLFVGVLNLVPYLQTFSLIPAVLLAVIKAAEYDQNFLLVLLSVALVYVVVQSIQELFLNPNILSKATGLKPAIILLSLSIFGSLLGLVGMIIALPGTSLIISYYKRFVIGRESITNEVDESPETNNKSETEVKAGPENNE
ncbi:MAG TPA: AI-2E family transporter [Bacteroidales bacterium]|nr:MAG: pheromone autoinducer 2 transporter [Bacteroidetes bacterium ADurb.Bin090]HPB36219.1 AI-2E family transporter [Bacteroidales bacterium]HQB71002.1 AI-2E family transporter [Bacteroidales bacterium]HQN88396.1 AI-2E family transporter [Bacteroidales bacterium]